MSKIIKNIKNIRKFKGKKYHCWEIIVKHNYEVTLGLCPLEKTWCFYLNKENALQQFDRIHPALILDLFPEFSHLNDEVYFDSCAAVTFNKSDSFFINSL